MAIPFRTRIAPTPSGYLHLGNAFNFLLTYLLARLHEGQVALRIDDGDATRTRPEYLEDIFSTLHWLGIEWDSGPTNVEDHHRTYSQGLRQDRYREALESLLSAGHGYACRCSRKQILALSPDGKYPGTCRAAMRSSYEVPFAVRTKLEPANAEVSIMDFKGGATPSNLIDTQGDFVIWRKDNLAAYQLVSTWEDEEAATTHIVRGKDLWDSTAAQLWLAQALGYQHLPGIKFLHHPLILSDSAEKLSKSAGATSLSKMREVGLTLNAVYHKFYQWLGITEAPPDSLHEMAQSDAFRKAMAYIA
ncbi:MAG: glutamate--tRNA ligase family protein [Bacteroidota bacterium]